MGRIKTLTGWTAHTGVLGDCTGSGTMALNGTSGFKASSYGTGTSIWHGAIMKKAIPNVGTGLGNFRADFRMTLKDTRVEQEGKLVVWLMDATDGIIATIEMADLYPSGSSKQPSMRLTDKWLMADWDNFNRANDNFTGHMTIQRVGNKWTAYVGNYRAGTQIDDITASEEWIDANNTDASTQKLVSKIAVGIMAYGTDTPVTTATIDELKVWKLNNIQVDETPYIFDIGDTIVIDSERSLVTINGKNAITVKDIFSRFPVIKEG